MRRDLKPALCGRLSLCNFLQLLIPPLPHGGRGGNRGMGSLRRERAHPFLFVENSCRHKDEQLALYNRAIAPAEELSDYG